MLKITQHIVNHVNAQYFDGAENIFGNIDDFCKWVFTKEHKGFTFIAHYGKGYDFQFVQDWLINKHGIKPNIISNGQKLLCLELKSEYNIRFIDSISFIQSALKEFPKTFDLTELCKGYFPHKFNTDENQNYVGKYPAKELYGYNEMTKKDKAKFDIWYETIKDSVFDFKEEMYKYCKSDVDILRRGCLKLRDLFMQISNIDPFQYITIASVCMAIYKNEFLPLNTIGVAKENQTDTYSIKSIKWLKYIDPNNTIRHALNGTEVSINIDGKKLKVDGYCEETNTIYQFHGCYFHGCKKCYDELTINKVNSREMKQLYDITIRNETALKTKYNLVTIWEHEFDNDKEMSKIKLNEDELIEPPKIRDCFYGGRTEPTKLIHNFKQNNQKGRYIDVCSLYPTVMYYDKYPVGHPNKDT